MRVSFNPGFLGIVCLVFLSVFSMAQDVPCDLTKQNGGGFSTTIESVVCDQTTLTHTIVLKVEHNGCSSSSCKPLDRYSVEAAPGTYSDISVSVIYGGMSYTSLNSGPVLPGDPFEGFRLDGCSGIGNGNAGVFKITYTLAGGLQNQKVSAHAFPFLQIASFTIQDFQYVMNCKNTGCTTNLTGPTAVDDNVTTPINTLVTVPVLSNDIPGSSPLIPSSVKFIDGTLPNAATIGTLTINGSNGSVTFFPVTGYYGIVTADYEVCDGNLLCDIASITITIPPPLTGPTATNDNATTAMNIPVNIPVLNNDIAGSSALNPGSVSFLPGTVPSPTTVGVFTVNGSTGVVTFTPANQFTGTTTVGYRVCDINLLCDEAFITIIVHAGIGDSDGDGCPDNVDDYPYDPLRCFNNYFPASGNGTLAFEDLWPGTGDYDFNDLVTDYRFTMVTNASNNIVEIFGKFIIKAFGASLHNGFGFQFANATIPQSNLQVTGYQLSSGYINLGTNGLEPGQDKPTIIVMDDCFEQMPFPGHGTGVNTTSGSPYVTPDTVDIFIDILSGNFTLAQLDIANFNPFLIVNQTRGHEVHLPNHPPTNLANPSLFGSGHDDTDPSQDRFYKTNENHPWAINIYQRFDYPYEMIDINSAYNHFGEWASSNGQLFPDWYMDKPGYRNQSAIYQP